MPRLALHQSANYKWWAFGALALGMFASVSDHGSVVVALPSIADYFETDLPTTQWVVIGYGLTIAALLMPMGRLADMIGLKPVYIAGFGVFVFGGLVAGFSQDILVLILAKVLQGVGAAMTQGTGMAMVVSSFSEEERGKSLGLQMSIVGTGGVAGPALGGFLVSAFTWRAVFFGTVAMGILAIIVAAIILDGRRYARRDGNKSAFDWMGAALSTGALVAFLMGMTAGSRIGWTSPYIVGTMVGFVAMLGAFVLWELHTPEPMMDMRLFKRRLFSLGVAASYISFLGMSSVRFLMPFYLQAVLGYSPGQVGLIIVPAASCMIITGPLSGRLSDRYGWRIFNVGGLLVSVAGLFTLSTLRTDSSLALVMTGMILQSIGTGTFNAPNNSAILSTVEKRKLGVVSGFLNLVRNSGNVTSIALATAIATGVMASMGFLPTLAGVSETNDTGLLEAFTAGLRWAYLIMGVVVLLGAGASLFKGSKVVEVSLQPVGDQRSRREGAA